MIPSLCLDVVIDPRQGPAQVNYIKKVDYNPLSFSCRLLAVIVLLEKKNYNVQSLRLYQNLHGYQFYRRLIIEFLMFISTLLD